MRRCLKGGRRLLTILVLNTLLLVCADVALAVFIARKGGIGAGFRNLLAKIDGDYGSERLNKAIKEYQNRISVKLSFKERIELVFIDKSNIRHYLPFANFYTLTLAVLLIFAAALKPVYGMLLFLPSSVIICFIFAMLPLFALDLLARYNSEVIRRKLAEFISVLNRWCAVKEDIFYAFEKSIESGVGEPLKTFVRDMVIQVNRGIEPTEALDMLAMKVDNVQFRDFIVNVKQNIRYRGDIIKLLTNLENQFYKIEEEFNRRKISTYKDRMLIYFIMFAVIFIAYFFMKFNPQIEQFYLATIEGKSLLTLFCILYSFGVYLTFGITQFKQ